MARAGIVFGLILCGITFAGLVGIPAKTPTQFYAMMLGIPILFCGVVALNPHRRRLAMMVAAAIAAVGLSFGVCWSVYQVISWSDGEPEVDRYSFRLIAIMSLVCIAFIGFCVVGFARMGRRSARREQGGTATVRLPSPSDKVPPDSDVPSSREIA